MRVGNKMAVEWFDDWLGEILLLEDEELDSFYCPYTNGSKCAVAVKGWQVQELCEALECDQLKFFQPTKRRRRKAA